jgi:hypothetical protein
MSYLLIGTHAGVAAAAVALTVLFTGARHEAAVGEIRVAQADAQLKAVGVARERERANNARTIKALNNAQTRNGQRGRQLASVQLTVDGLRDQLIEANNRIGRASREAVDQYAVAANAVLGDCQRRYTEMAGKAQGHADDVRTFSESWPSNER